MIKEDVFGIEPWTVPEYKLDLDLLAQTESVFALSNGHLGLRGNLDEGEPFGVPGTYLNAFYEQRPLPYAEAGYGYPEAGQTMINVTNGKVLRLLVDDEPFDVRYGELIEHHRTLDLAQGVLRRAVDWRSPAGQGVRIRSTRLVSFVQRSVAAIEYEVEPLEGSTRIVVQSELVANEPLDGSTRDPRAAAALMSPLEAEQNSCHELRAGLVHSTRASCLRMAAGMDHVVEGPEGTITAAESDDDLARVTISTELRTGERLRVVKFLAYCWSSRRSIPSVRDQMDASLAAARRTGWRGLYEGQVEYMNDFWERADVELDGDAELQQATRFGLFHVLQSAARAEQRAIPAKGLTGRGYDGHAFWDMEMYTLPVLTYTAPDAASDAIRWRHATMDLAESRAKELGLKGVTFPWRTIRGQECSGYWPAGTAAFHVNSGVAESVRRYVAATGDEEFEQGPGLDILVATARMWRSLGHHDATGGFRIDGVTGPDEYSALMNNNVYTNLMAARNLRMAADLAARHPDRAEDLEVDQEEIAGWRDAANAMIIPFDEELGVTAQSEAFTRQRRWDFDRTERSDYPLMMTHPYFLLYSSQVIKQADLVMALYACGEHFSQEQKVRDFEYYERMTVRDSSLSACMQGIVAAEVGHLELAYEYLGETSLIDLRDLAFNTRDGLHIAALSGTWLLIVAGFGGMRDYGEVLSFAPQLPPRLHRIGFNMLYKGGILRVRITPRQASYEVRDGKALTILHYGEEVTVEPGQTAKRKIPQRERRPRVEQPRFRTPLHLRPTA